MYTIKKYKTESGKCPFDDFIIELKKDGKLLEINKIQHYIKYLRDYGYKLPSVNKDIAKRIDARIYELRPVPNRIFYFYSEDEETFVLLHGFKKKSNETPKPEIEKAKREVLDYERMRKNGRKEF